MSIGPCQWLMMKGKNGRLGKSNPEQTVWCLTNTPCSYYGAREVHSFL